MKKIVVILTVLLTGCGTRSTDKITSGNEPDSLENFHEFFKKFTSDSLFQIERVKFPWTIINREPGEDAPAIEIINKEDWRFASFYYEDSYATRKTDAYTQETKTYGDTIKIEVRGVDNGIYVDYEFAKMNNKWFLVGEKDFSN